MYQRLLFLLSAVLLFGCATEQRLGESRIQSRRYSKGFHVQHHREAKPAPQSNRGAMPAEATAAAQPQPESNGVTLLETEAVMDVVKALERAGLAAPSFPEAGRVTFMEPRLPKGIDHETRVELLSSEELPEAVEGRHPESVPGFILSLGWAFGLIGEAAVTHLEMPVNGVPIALGVLASIIGYILSRRAYRLSLEHPDRYPRYRLSRAARFVSFGFLAPIALYVAIVLLVILLLGGIRIM